MRAAHSTPINPLSLCYRNISRNDWPQALSSLPDRWDHAVLLDSSSECHSTAAERLVVGP
jgi:hypothetical protein